jgi:hypothetical protein
MDCFDLVTCVSVFEAVEEKFLLMAFQDASHALPSHQDLLLGLWVLLGPSLKEGVLWGGR